MPSDYPAKFGQPVSVSSAETGAVQTITERTDPFMSGYPYAADLDPEDPLPK
jgi:hypothetical protein